MVSLEQLQTLLTTPPPQTMEYECQADLNLYDSPQCSCLATQAARGRHLQILTIDTSKATQVQLCEDDYPGWLKPSDLDLLTPAPVPYRAIALSEEEIRVRLPAVIAFTKIAMAQPNTYLWGGTVGPNYDCSGLIQTAFASLGIWLPRDAYQQETFVQTLPPDFATLEPGDLIFFGPPAKATHVGLYLSNNAYIHSSGSDQGRNGIGIDYLAENVNPVSTIYYRQLRQAGRVLGSYQPQTCLHGLN